MKSDFRMRRRLALALVPAVAACLGAPAHAQASPVSLRDSVAIGSNGLCEAQLQSPRPGEGLFDRRYLVVCRDAAAPVGQLWVVSQDEADSAYETAVGGGRCEESVPETMPGLANARAFICNSDGSSLSRTVMTASNGRRAFAASGLTVYDDALRLGLATLAADRPVPGDVEVPLTQAGDGQAFARAQAEAISAELALDEAYRRSNAGNFADAAEFFEASASTLQGNSATEAMLNAALQQSNLGNFAEAGELFGQAEPLAANDPILARLTRNFEAIDALNRERPNEALDLLLRELPAFDGNVESTLQLQIDDALAERLAAEQGNGLSGVAANLTLLERAQLLDAQASYIRASALRQLGRTGEADGALLAAHNGLLAVRDGRVVSVLWLRAQVLAERAELRERAGDVGGAEAMHREAVQMLEAHYAATPALLSARAQLAGLYARTGRESEALDAYRAMVANAGSKPASALRRLLAPYFNLLGQHPGDSGAAADMFDASQLLLRPGLAQTQAVLARELSAGSDEAAQLFRQAINLNRGIEVARARIAQAEAASPDLPGATEALAARRTELALLEQRQLEVQQRLGEYPRYRVVSDSRMALPELQQALRPGEAYLKLVMLADRAYAIYAEPGMATAYSVAASPDEIGTMVDTIRDSIAIDQGGQTITYPFDIALARQLYSALFGPVAAQLRAITHLVFEPDGAMLRLPANLLVMDDASVDAYAARTADPQADPYDFRGTAWLGRAMQVTTAVSPTSFRDVRNARASNARAEYLGLGQNVPLTPAQAQAQDSGTRGGGVAGARCTWSPLTWNNPIKDDELRTASGVLQAEGEQTALLTRGDFTDTQIKQRGDLDEFRILHFATHGLVTPPQPDCPPRPALLTSFGGPDSDGLLTFGEIFDLKIDADLVILSACNTAAIGGLVASREAGITSGGDFALDGLVRAFVGAGGRTVVASHWPVPDDYGATGRLMSAFFDTAEGVGTANALQSAQQTLMDDADTSHPFYWSAFAVVGDGTIPVRR